MFNCECVPVHSTSGATQTQPGLGATVSEGACKRSGQLPGALAVGSNTVPVRCPLCIKEAATPRDLIHRPPAHSDHAHVMRTLVSSPGSQCNRIPGSCIRFGSSHPLIIVPLGVPPHQLYGSPGRCKYTLQWFSRTPPVCPDLGVDS